LSSKAALIEYKTVNLKAKCYQ